MDLQLHLSVCMKYFNNVSNLWKNTNHILIDHVLLHYFKEPNSNVNNNNRNETFENVLSCAVGFHQSC